MKPLSRDLRERIVNAHEQEGQSYTQVAKRFAVSRSSVKRFVKQWRATQDLTPKAASNGSQPTLDAADTARLRVWLEQRVETSQDELREQLAVETGKVVSQPTICRTLQRARLTRKKRQNEL
jgi:transposase